MTPRAALFDLDRTLVPKQTGQLYVKYQRDRGGASWLDDARVAWWVLQYSLGLLDTEQVAERALSAFRGMHESVLARRCEELFDLRIAKIITPPAFVAVARHLDRGDHVAIVTGASRYVAGPVARALSIPHIVYTEYERDDAGCFTGKYIQPLCYGPGKIVHTERLAARLGFDLEEATFYTDSISDLPLLERVGTPIAINPDVRLRRIARQRSWRVETWE